MYELIYDYNDETNIMEDFTGTWSQLQLYIKEMRKQGCYNITANSVEG